MNSNDINWWRGGAIYQIYPRSFYDSNGDGIGDLKGITEKLDYVASLGVEAIWISPFFKSPMLDFGYDVSDFRRIDEIFGTMEDFEELLDQAHDRGLKIIIDLVLSHTSDQHEWFRESCKGKNTNKFDDWYVWADPKPDGSAPNNWQSVFGGPAWSFNAKRGQYYLHNFLKEQPDLNYHNPDVQEEALNTAKFWLDKGVDGFRLDVVNFYFHDQELRDNPPRRADDGNGCIQYEGLWPYTMQHHVYDKSRPENTAFLEKIRSMTDDYDAFLVGEIGDDTPFALAADYTSGDERLHTAYSTAMMAGQSVGVKADDFIEPVTQEKEVTGKSWPCWAFSNHDTVRVASRWEKNNPDEDPQFVKMLMAVLACLRGTFCLYQGEELGFKEAQLKYEDLVDPWGIALWPEWQGRDGCRTPMAWNEYMPHAGFTRDEAQPWLPVCRKHYPLAVRQQQLDKNSSLNFTKDFLKWRKDQQVLKTGDIEFLETSQSVLAFKRYDDIHTYICLFNLAKGEERVELNTNLKETLYSLGADVSCSSVFLSSFGFAVVSV